MSTTILTNEQIIRILEENRPEYDGLDKAIAVSRAIEQAVLQSPEVQRLKAIESAAERVLSMPQEDGYIVLTVHLDALRAAMSQGFDVPIHTAPQPAEPVKVSDDLAHEIWAAAQTAPGEGIEDAVERIAALLARYDAPDDRSDEPRFPGPRE